MAADTTTALRWMTDSAFPMGTEPKTTPDGHAIDTVLIYAGGDTPHPWTPADIAAMPFRYRWPCWVRSNPNGFNGASEAALFTAWLHHHGVPQGTYVILDLETAVDGVYVSAFNLAMRAAGYKVTKYGSQGFIWGNPPTDGGTYVAAPGSDVLTTEGDTVARQYLFAGGFDISVLKDQPAMPLWDTKPGPPPPPPGDAVQPSHVTGEARWTNAKISWVTGAGTKSIEVFLADAKGQTINKMPLMPPATSYTFRHIHMKTHYKLGILAKPAKTGTTAQYVDVTTL